MSKVKFLFAVVLLAVPCTFVGCGGSEDVTVVPEAPEMSAEAEAEYEEGAQGGESGGDEQN